MCVGVWVCVGVCKKVCMYVHVCAHLSVCMKYLGSQWTDYYYDWYFIIFRKSLGKDQVTIQSDKTLRQNLCAFRILPT